MQVCVDLPSQTVVAGDLGPYRFAIRQSRKECLIEGLEDAQLTARYADAIDGFERGYLGAFPWLA